MTDRDHDDALKRLYQDHGGEEPPAALDRLIRDRARREAGPDARPAAAVPTARRWRHAGRWSGLAAAAVVVLALGIVLRAPDPVPSFELSDDATRGATGRTADTLMSADAATSAEVATPTDEAPADAGAALSGQAKADGPTGTPGRTSALAQGAGQALSVPRNGAALRETLSAPVSQDPAPGPVAKEPTPAPAPQEPAALFAAPPAASTPAGAERREEVLIEERTARVAGPCGAARTLSTASDERYRLCSGNGGVTLRHDGCAEPWPVPPGTDVTAGQFGVGLARAGEAATVYCRDGQWLVEPGPERTPPDP